MKYAFLKTIAIGSAILTLLACGTHQNPLSQHSTKASAKFLVKASQYAEKKLSIKNEGNGGAYRQCMIGDMKSSVCKPIYQKMLVYAHQTNQFKDLRSQDLSDGKVWDSISDDYLRLLINRQ